MTDTAAKQAIEVGTVLAGTYEIKRLVGRGGMGAVWEARHMRLEGKRVAIKVLHAEVAGDAESVARFRREAQIASRLGHPNIVQVHDFNELPDGTQYLVLEYLEGESLSDRLARGPIPVDHALAIVRQVGSALHAAHHENIVHRDLKPHNVFLCPTETGGYATEQAKVLDFGISKIRGSQTVKTQTSMMLGTPQYMAPEQALGDHAAADARTDIFALGVMVYEMLLGRPAFQGTSIPEVVFKVVYEEPPNLGALVPSLAPTLVAAVHRAMAKKQADRFPDVSSFVEALTGDPLTTLRGHAGGVMPMKPLAPGQTGERARGQDAFAATMPPGAGMASTQGATPSALAGTQGATPSALASAQAPASTPGAMPVAIAAHTPVQHAAFAAGPMYGGAPAAETQRVRKGSTGLILGLVAVAAAVAVTVVVMRGQGKDTAETPVPAASLTSAAAAAAEAAAGANKARVDGLEAVAGASKAVADTAAAAEQLERLTADMELAGSEAATALAEARAEAERIAAEAARGTTGDEPTPRSRDGEDSEDEPQAGPALEKLSRARELLEAEKLDEAIQVARSSLGDRRTAAAYAILTAAYCAKGDLGNALANAVHVKGRRERKRLAALCARHDIDITAR